MKHGFDCTGFGSAHQWRELVGRAGLKYVGHDEGQPAFYWTGKNGLLVVTGNNPETGEYLIPGRREREPGYASYIGIEGMPADVLDFAALVRGYAESIKGESKGQRGFI